MVSIGTRRLISATSNMAYTLPASLWFCLIARAASSNHPSQSLADLLLVFIAASVPFPSQGFQHFVRPEPEPPPLGSDQVDGKQPLPVHRVGRGLRQYAEPFQFTRRNQLVQDQGLLAHLDLLRLVLSCAYPYIQSFCEVVRAGVWSNL